MKTRISVVVVVVLLTLQANAGHVSECLGYDKPHYIASDSIKYVYGEKPGQSACFRDISYTTRQRLPCYAPPPSDDQVAGFVNSVLTEATRLRRLVDDGLPDIVWNLIEDEVGGVLTFHGVHAAIDGPISATLKGEADSDGVVRLSLGPLTLSGSFTARLQGFLGSVSLKANLRARNAIVHIDYDINRGTVTAQVDDSLDVAVSYTSKFGQIPTTLFFAVVNAFGFLDVYTGDHLERILVNVGLTEHLVGLDDIPIGRLVVGGVDIGLTLKNALEDFVEDEIEEDFVIRLTQEGTSVSNAHVKASYNNYHLTIGRKDGRYPRRSEGPQIYCF